jgi:predicted Zn-ribbon and HTH transcriptional regulator
MAQPDPRQDEPARVSTPPVKVYRCQQCRKVLFEARGVKGLSKRCPRCKKVNIYDE